MADSKTMYFDLMSLCMDSESGFYYVDQEYNTRKYRIFLYRITSYTYWQKAGATFGRGTVYDITDVGRLPILVSLCMEKFFNVGENPLAPTREELTDDNIHTVVDKADGSLITAFLSLDGEVVLKSKGSFHSTQAVRAREIYESDAFCFQRQFIEDVLENGENSVNMEFTSPDNLIVVRYPEDELRILNVVQHDSGWMYPIVRPQDKIENFNYDEVLNDWRDREGVVIYTRNRRVGYGSQAVKLKSNWYLALHRVRSEITNPIKVAKVVLQGGIDDMRSAFPEFTDWINLVEDQVVREYNNFESYLDYMVNYFKDTYSHLPYREYKKTVALEAQETLENSNKDRGLQLFTFANIMQSINEKSMPEEKIIDFFAERCKGLSMPIIEKYAL